MQTHAFNAVAEVRSQPDFHILGRGSNFSDTSKSLSFKQEADLRAFSPWSVGVPDTLRTRAFLIPNEHGLTELASGN